MPFYQFTAPTGSATLTHRAEIAEAMTKVHSEITGAPAKYVHCSFNEVATGSIFAAGKPATGPRMMPTIREGRTAEVRAELIHGLADAWCAITGDAKEDVAVFVQEVPGGNVLEDGVILPEAADD